METNDFTETCKALRGEIKGTEDLARSLRDEAPHGCSNEVPANVTLAIRHLEDARMRLGKAIQYAGDGVSCYDKGESPGD